MNANRKSKVEVTIRYRIYLVDGKGMLERPKTSWGDGEDKYSDCADMEEAVRLIEAADDWASYVILPVTHTSIAN